MIPVPERAAGETKGPGASSRSDTSTRTLFSLSAGRSATWEQVSAWYRTNARPFPWRAPGTSPWAILLIEFMAQQTQIERAGAAWAVWLERWPRPADLAATPPAEAVKAWGRLGYPRRALALHATATEIAQRHAGEVPSDVATLLTLPGVGPYTAAAVASFAYGVRTPVVDTNVRRVLARAVLGQAEAGPPSRSDLDVMAAVLPDDPEETRLVNAGAMELGALICTPRSPRCDACPLASSCAWRAAGYPPYEGAKRARQPRFEGSDRQARGLVMAELRAADHPIPREDLAERVPDAEQLERSLASLIRDGLAVETRGGYSLP